MFICHGGCDPAEWRRQCRRIIMTISTIITIRTMVPMPMYMKFLSDAGLPEAARMSGISPLMTPLCCPLRRMANPRRDQEHPAAGGFRGPSVLDIHPAEENPQDIRKGESYAAEVISRVMHGRGWPHTLLIWVYDEHGGYYDHVPPPAAIPPDEVEGRSVIGSPSRLETMIRWIRPSPANRKEDLTAGPHRYDRYGFRVPAVIISPYARPDYVCSKVLDHTSILKLVADKWNLPALTARDAAADTPLDALDLTGPPAFLQPPALPAPALRWGTW
jgi:hypothetical protein